MAGEKAAGNQPANSGGGNANKGPNKNNRRRSLRSKRRGRKPEEGNEARDPRESREARLQPHAAKPLEKNVRDNRERRRRRRMRTKQRGQNEPQTPVVEDSFKDLPPLVPAFVYTHVLRPAIRDSFEFRTEHFSKVTRRMEDFHIDLSPLYPDGGDEIKGVAYMPPLAESAEFARDFAEGNVDGSDDPENDEGYDEGYDDPHWDAEQSEDAARLEGATTAGAAEETALEETAPGEIATVAIADDFYADLDDSVLDEYPEEDIDA